MPNIPRFLYTVKNKSGEIVAEDVSAKDLDKLFNQVLSTKIMMILANDGKYKDYIITRKDIGIAPGDFVSRFGKRNYIEMVEVFSMFKKLKVDNGKC